MILRGRGKGRKGKERERQSLERFIEPIEPLEPFEPLEPLEPLAASKTKTKINPLMRMEGDALLPNPPPWSYKSELLTPKPKDCAPLHHEGHHPHQGDKQE